MAAVTRLDRGVAKAILEWGRGRFTEFPWRREPRDPYAVWVAEVMLQQTQIATVPPYYAAFLARFPDVRSLAESREADVMKVWEGLGYYRRARLLHRGAQHVLARGGGVPDSREALADVPGIGPYMSAAIAALAYNAYEVPVDGNVLRVATRILDVDWDTARPATARRVENILRDVIPEGEARAFAEALFDLGRTVCSPRAPRCEDCPVMHACAARANGTITARPIKTRGRPPRDVAVAAAFVRDKRGRVLLAHRADGLLGGMWGLPWVEGDAHALAEAYGVAVTDDVVAELAHVYTHQKWRLRVHAATRKGHAPAGCEWVDEARVRERAMGGVFTRALALITENEVDSLR